MYVPYNVHICSYVHIHELAKQVGGVHWGDIGQVAHHPLYILQLPNHPHSFPAPGGSTPYLEGADICTSLLVLWFPSCGVHRAIVQGNFLISKHI